MESSLRPQSDKGYLLGVDGGTESLRAGIFDLDGALISSAATPHETRFPYPGWAEQDPRDWWRALGESVRAAVDQSGLRPEQIGAYLPFYETYKATYAALRSLRREL